MSEPARGGGPQASVAAAMPGDRADPESLFDEVLRVQGPALRRVAALYEPDPARREDLFQEICLALWRALPAFRGDASVCTFAFRVAHNRGLTHRSRRRRAPAALEEAGEPQDPGPGPEAGVDRAQRRARLRDALLALPLTYRQVLGLALEELSHREVAEVLGITENNVAVRLSRARSALRRRLEATGGSER